jgi:hypothetical protein
MISDILEGSRLFLFQVKFRFLRVSLLRSQCLVCRASICWMKDASNGSDLDRFQFMSRFLCVSLGPLNI